MKRYWKISFCWVGSLKVKPAYMKRSSHQEFMEENNTKTLHSTEQFGRWLRLCPSMWPHYPSTFYNRFHVSCPLLAWCQSLPSWTNIAIRYTCGILVSSFSKFLQSQSNTVKGNAANTAILALSLCFAKTLCHDTLLFCKSTK